MGWGQGSGNPDSEGASPRAGMGRLVAILVIAVALGALLIGYLWDIANALLAGHGSARDVLIALPLLVVLVGLLRYLMRVIAQLDPGGTRNVG